MGGGDQELGPGHVFVPINHLVPSRTLGNAQEMSGGHPIFLSWGRGASFFPTPLSSFTSSLCNLSDFMSILMSLKCQLSSNALMFLSDSKVLVKRE